MIKRVEPEGSPFTKIVQFIRDEGYSKPVNIEIATVTAAPPNLKITLDGDGLELDGGDLVIAEHLTRHDRIVSLDYRYPNTVDLGDGSEPTDSSRNNVGSAPAEPYEQYEMKYATMTYEDVLKVGDRVIVACLDEDMVYVVLDRAVWYA